MEWGSRLFVYFPLVEARTAKARGYPGVTASRLEVCVAPSSLPTLINNSMGGTLNVEIDSDFSRSRFRFGYRIGALRCFVLVNLRPQMR